MSRKTTSPTRRSKHLREVELLETRKLMSVSQTWFDNDRLCVRTDDAATSVEVRQIGADIVIRDVMASKSWNFAANRVGAIEFQGGAGSDRFVNNVDYLPTRAFGNGGNDYLEGCNAVDVFMGGDGDDELVGNGGNDQFWGEAGNDILSGCGGSDQLAGGDGDDQLYGQSDQDQLWGGAGNDILHGGSGSDQLAGGDGDDQLFGGSGNDRLWGDNHNDVLLGGSGNDQLMGGHGEDQLNGQTGDDWLWGQDGDDVLVTLDAGTCDWMSGGGGLDAFWVDRNGSWADTVADVSIGDKLQQVSSFANGADRTLDGDVIADPTVQAGITYRAFLNNPLFVRSGPGLSDIRQGAIGDCYLLAGLGAIANDSPLTLRQNVVDFNDGTYGVRLGNSFYRVDNELPVKSGSTQAAFADLGRQNSMWVAVVEKAFAHYRRGQNSYASIDGGLPEEASRAFGATDVGSRMFASYGTARALTNDLYNRWNRYQLVTVSFVGGAANGPVVLSHAYTVASIIQGAAGMITGIVLRNPWGFDGGSQTDSNQFDGLVTLTPAQLFQYRGRVSWGLL